MHCTADNVGAIAAAIETFVGKNLFTHDTIIAGRFQGYQLATGEFDGSNPLTPALDAHGAAETLSRFALSAAYPPDRHGAARSVELRGYETASSLFLFAWLVWAK
jgi:hypothetical protein